MKGIRNVKVTERSHCLVDSLKGIAQLFQLSPPDRPPLMQAVVDDKIALIFVDFPLDKDGVRAGFKLLKEKIGDRVYLAATSGVSRDLGIPVYSSVSIKSPILEQLRK